MRCGVTTAATRNLRRDDAGGYLIYNVLQRPARRVKTRGPAATGGIDGQDVAPCSGGGRVVVSLAAPGAILAEPAGTPKSGGILRVWLLDSPASMSILEESTVVAERPVMGVFNNLVMFDQHVEQNSLASIVPDLASDWAWDEDGTHLTFHLRHGIKWHDGKPFTAADVKCTWDLLQGKAPEKLRLNPRKGWYTNLVEVTTNGDYEAIFALKRPQPAFIALLASGMSPVYPCHVSPAQMRQHPIGTGPFKFVEFKPNESIRLVENPDYWKPGLPYLDRIDYGIVRNRSTIILAFIAGQYDLTFAGSVSVPLMYDIEKQRPDAHCVLPGGSVSTNLVVNRSAPPFDNPDLRRAMALTIDRKSFVDILTEGTGLMAAAMQPPPGGLWGLPKEMLEKLPGYGPDVEKSRTEARAIMKQLGYGPENPLKVKIVTRDIPAYRDPAVILIDQLKEIYIKANCSRSTPRNGIRP